MAGSGGIVAGLAGRYAAALFELASEAGSRDAVATSLDRVRLALADSADLRRMTTSPVLARADAERGILAVADGLGLDPLARGFLGVLARARRLASLPQIIAGYRALAARARGETSAIVTSARALSGDQIAQLRATLKAKLRQEVDIELRVDPAILGGLVVKIGSRMIDSSIRTKLAAVGAAMRG